MPDLVHAVTIAVLFFCFHCFVVKRLYTQTRCLFIFQSAPTVLHRRLLAWHTHSSVLVWSCQHKDTKATPLRFQ